LIPLSEQVSYRSKVIVHTRVTKRVVIDVMQDVHPILRLQPVYCRGMYVVTLACFFLTALERVTDNVQYTTTVMGFFEIIPMRIFSPDLREYSDVINNILYCNKNKNIFLFNEILFQGHT